MTVIQTLDPILGTVAVRMIRGYQRYLSPYKGFSCAHRAKYGGRSCSEYAAFVFSTEGLCAGLTKLRSRFQACHAASRELREARTLARTHDPDFDPPVDNGQKPAPAGTEDNWPLDCAANCAAECCCRASGDACLGAIFS